MTGDCANFWFRVQLFSD